MKKMFRFLCIFSFLFFFCISNVFAKENDKITLYLFHSSDCPHCKAEIKFLDGIEDDYPNLKIVKYEVAHNEENSMFMNKVGAALEEDTNYIPFTVIGDIVIVGYDENTGPRIERAIRYYNNMEYEDVVQQIKDGTYKKNDKKDESENKEEKNKFKEEEKKSDEAMTVKVPFIGNVNLKNVSALSGAVILGTLDGFNPCAMWILLFLISMLIGLKDRKKMWILGLTFLGTSALVYMAIMLSWLNIVVRISTVIWIRNIIAIIAIIGGIINLRSFIKSNDSGCSVVDKDKRKKIFDRIRKFTSEKSLILAVIGIMGLAVSVNLVELACSAGLPLIFTQLLAINGIDGISGFYYTFIYIMFFLLDDLIIFFIAMFTMKVTGISTKYSKYSHLIGGILMFIIGLLLLFKPEWLMFQFN